MADISQSAGVIRFGVFEVDLRAGELRKNGLKIRLPEQPFQVLALLLERPGEVVTREEIRQRLWSSDTFVDFDRAVNTAINRIREALGDSANNPRFVETLPRRGYRFVFPIESLAATKETREARSSPGSEVRSWSSLKARWFWVPLVLLVPVAYGLWWLFGLGGSDRTSEPNYHFRQLTRDPGLTYQPALSTDGKLLAYSSDRAGKGDLDIYVQQVGSTQTVPLTDHPADDWFPSFSPDGTQVVFRSERNGGGIYLTPSLGGDETLLVPEGRSPRFSPDGEWIAFSKGLPLPRATSVYLISTGGGDPIPLETTVSHATMPLWSPDGRHIMFWGWHEGAVTGRRWELYVAPREGGGAVQTGFTEVLADAGIDYWHQHYGARQLGERHGQWCADHSYVFDAVSPGGALNVYRVAISPETFRVEGTPQPLTGGTNEWQPTVARDGLVAFVERELSREIWSVAIDGNDGKVLGDLRPEVRPGPSYGWPGVTADGRKLVFNCDRRGNRDVWIKDLVSGEERPLTATPADDRAPSISPDGSKVVFIRGHDLVWVPSTGGSAKKLATRVGDLPSWFSDSRRLLRRSPDSGSWLSVDVETGDVGEALRGRSDGRFGSVIVSPDGARISFHFPGEQSPRTIFVAPLHDGVAADRAEWVEVTKVETLTRNWWSPDGNLLYFLWAREGPYEIWARRLDEATKRPLGEPFQVTIPLQPNLSLTGHTVGLTAERLYMALQQTTGNIWLAEPQQQ